MTSDLLAPLDLAFWNIESAEHPMHLGALGVFAAHSPTAGAHAEGGYAATEGPGPKYVRDFVSKHVKPNRLWQQQEDGPPAGGAR